MLQVVRPSVEQMSPVLKTVKLFRAAARKLVFQPTEAWLLLRLATCVTFVSLIARLYSLPETLRLISSKRKVLDANFDLETQEHLARSLDQLLSINTLGLRPVCWKRAAVLHRFLARRGVATSICFGVKTDSEGNVDGHAWLEAAGVPILEKETPNFVVTYTFPADEQLPFPAAVLN